MRGVCKIVCRCRYIALKYCYCSVFHCCTYVSLEYKPHLLRACVQAERSIVDKGLNKEYAGITGVPEFVQASVEFALSKDSPAVVNKTVSPSAWDPRSVGCLTMCHSLVVQLLLCSLLQLKPSRALEHCDWEPSFW